MFEFKNATLATTKNEENLNLNESKNSIFSKNDQTDEENSAQIATNSVKKPRNSYFQSYDKVINNSNSPLKISRSSNSLFDGNSIYRTSKETQKYDVLHNIEESEID